MLIKLAILDRDQRYLSRISAAFQTKYVDKIELYTFTDLDKAFAAINQSQINVVLASPEMDIDRTEIASSCGFAYLVEAPDVDTFNAQRAICKYQKTETLVRAITDIFADSSDERTSMAKHNSTFPISLFVSASGGVGTSIIALAAARTIALSGKKPLFISFDIFGSPNLYLNGEGKLNMGDVIYSLKSRKSNLSLKLESVAKRDPSGVLFYSEPDNALNLNEINTEDLNALFGALSNADFCDCAMIDINLSFDERCLFLLTIAKRVVFISDGSDVANAKLVRAITAFKVLASDSNVNVFNKSCLFYNKFSNKVGKQIDNCEIPIIGGSPRFEHLSSPQVIQRLIDEKITSPITDFLTGGFA